MNENQGPVCLIQEKNQNEGFEMHARTELPPNIDICKPNDLFDHKRFRVVSL